MEKMRRCMRSTKVPLYQVFAVESRMQYRELRRLKFDYHQFDEFQSHLAALGITAPSLVSKQFYFDHRDNTNFLQQYGHLDLYRLHWEEITLTTLELCQVSMHEGMSRWSKSVAQKVEAVAQRGAAFTERGSRALDTRADVVAHWSEHRTWKTPPVLIDKAITKPRGERRHLVEGHTRIGCLRGLFAAGELPEDSTHLVFWGTLQAPLATGE